MTSEEHRDSPLPVYSGESSDGFTDEQEGDRVIVGLLYTFTTDGQWLKGGIPVDPADRPVAVGTKTILQCWMDQRVVDTRWEHPLPDPDKLNKSIPVEQWGVGFNGAPRGPWQRAHILYFLDVATAERSTFASSAIGAGIAVSRLKDQIVWMGKLRGGLIVPQIEFASAPFKTRFGLRLRADFRVAGWIDLGSGGGLDLAPPSAPKQLPPAEPKQVAEPNLAEVMDDSIPW
jgi:hypothetical protein